MVKKAKSKTTENANARKSDAAKEAGNHDSSYLNECNKAFGFTDLYSILGLNKSDATQGDIKKAYYRLSLKYHPDKCENESLKKECNFKFQLLGRLYSILSDEDKKKLYDECGIIDGENEDGNGDWATQWRTMFKKITVEDIVSYFNEYKNSQREREDLFRIYEKHKGDFNLIVQYMISEDMLEDEERFKIMLNEAISKGEIESYELFVKEDKKKAAKRKAKFEKEAIEAEQLKNEILAKMPKTKLDGSDESLMLAIRQNSQRRHNDMLESLTEKYVKKNSKEKKLPNKKSKDDDEDENDENLQGSEAEEDSFFNDDVDGDDDNDDEDDDDDEEEEAEKKSNKKSSIIKKKPSTLQRKPSTNLKSRSSIKRKIKRL